MHKYETALLNSIRQDAWTEFEEALRSSKLSRNELLWAIENLLPGGYIEVQRREVEKVELTEEGAAYATSQMPEELILAKAKKGRLRLSELASKEEQIGFQWAKKKGLVTINAAALELTALGAEAAKKGVEEGEVLRKVAKSPESYPILIEGKKEAVLNLHRRGLISIKKRSEIAGIRLTPKGAKAQGSEQSAKQIDALSKGMIANGSWKGSEFKPYDVTINVERERMAMRHPVRATMKKVAQTYLSLGFMQMSGPIIEPAFWVFDSLFVPQDHPAREMQDTFYLSNPERLGIGKEGTAVERIRDAHIKSWGGEWTVENAERAVLRTHTTNISVRQINATLRKIFAEEGEYELPVKLFSIGRVFRNENVDYRHLTDFYQHEGIVIGNNLTFANLFDILISIYRPLGLELKFKPAYFPFVEPGVEFYAYSEKTKEWIEMGGAGMIRREVTGAPRKSITVLAWGPGLERIMLLKDPEIRSITELYNNEIGWLRKRRMV